MGTYVQKNIIIDSDYKTLKKYIAGNTENNLTYKMRMTITEYVTKEEQTELDSILKDILSQPIEIDEEETVIISI